MNRTPLLTAAALTASLALAVPALAGSAAATPLTGTVGPGFTITLAKRQARSRRSSTART